MAFPIPLWLKVTTMSISQANALPTKGMVDFHHGHFRNLNEIIDSDTCHQRVIKIMIWKTVRKWNIYTEQSYRFACHYSPAGCPVTFAERSVCHWRNPEINLSITVNGPMALFVPPGRVQMKQVAPSLEILSAVPPELAEPLDWTYSEQRKSTEVKAHQDEICKKSEGGSSGSTIRWPLPQVDPSGRSGVVLFIQPHYHLGRDLSVALKWSIWPQ